jgi:hypothetical protein
MKNMTFGTAAPEHIHLVCPLLYVNEYAALAE